MLPGIVTVAALFGLALLSARTAMAETEADERAAIVEATKLAFMGGDFGALEQASGQYRREKSRIASGLWKLTIFYAGIDAAMYAHVEQSERDVAFNVLDEIVNRWVAAYPKSPSAQIARGRLLINRAWAHRGSGYGSSVTEEGWLNFRKYIAAARSNFEEQKAVASVDPKWYEEMLIVARAQSWSPVKFEALVDEALAREPQYYQTYFMVLENLLPKWGGSIDEIEAFAQDAVRRTKHLEGQGMYARVYWFVSQTEFKNDIFNSSLVDWAQMKAGFEDIISRYPDAWNLNNYARFACLARDKAKTAELLKRIESTVVADAWVPLILKDQCARWASQP